MIKTKQFYSHTQTLSLSLPLTHTHTHTPVFIYINSHTHTQTHFLSYKMQFQIKMRNICALHSGKDKRIVVCIKVQPALPFLHIYLCTIWSNFVLTYLGYLQIKCLNFCRGYSLNPSAPFIFLLQHQLIWSGNEGSDHQFNVENSFEKIQVTYEGMLVYSAAPLLSPFIC